VLGRSPRRPWPPFAKGSKGRSPKSRAISVRPPPNELLASAPKGALTFPPPVGHDLFQRKGAPRRMAPPRDRSLVQGPSLVPNSRRGRSREKGRRDPMRRDPLRPMRRDPHPTMHRDLPRPMHRDPRPTMRRDLPQPMNGTPRRPRGSVGTWTAPPGDRPKGPSVRAGTPPDQRRMTRARGPARLTIPSQNPKGFPRHRTDATWVKKRRAGSLVPAELLCSTTSRTLAQLALRATIWPLTKRNWLPWFFLRS
jgi:hypothetical protein